MTGEVFSFAIVVDFGGASRWAEGKWERSTEDQIVVSGRLFIKNSGWEARGLGIERVFLGLLVSKQ